MIRTSREGFPPVITWRRELVNENDKRGGMTMLQRGIVAMVGLILGLIGGSTVYGATQFNWAAAGVGGAYYPLSIAIGKVIEKHVPEVKITIETTGGGVENARLVGAGDNDLGMANSNFNYFALKGMDPYKKAYKLYSAGYLYAASLHIIVPAHSPIKSIKDFKGKKIAIGPAGGGTIGVFRDILPFYGMKETDMKLSFISFSDGTRALTDGSVDVNMLIAGAPAAAAKELSETTKVRFISVEEDVIKKLREKYGYYVRIVFPKAMFKTAEDVVAVGGGVEWIVRDGISEDLIYKMVKAVFEHLGEIATSHPQGKEINLETAPMTAIPLHPGAIKYYREKGVLK
jgi:TRAP transporter TAXI family solute receptor